MRLINHLLVFFVTFFLFFTSTSFVMASEINRNPTQMELEKNIKLRKTLGFDINRNHVLSILNDENKEERFSYGFTKEEAKEFDRRMKFQKDEVPKIKQKVFEKINENNIGSFYIDQKNNGKLILGITVGTPKSTIEKIKKEINELTTESECVWQNKSAELCKGKMQSPALNFCA
ncbi:hypothetical protein [Ureibacillus thermosphaericus]|uniref:hypothetical protein n=1 Tax=Ureibacillus thermosphaericus TaxID=51173 RepID=UPI000BBC841C|nr:hypothetical protein [Ureibacillus thermosphaericus]